MRQWHCQFNAPVTLSVLCASDIVSFMRQWHCQFYAPVTLLVLCWPYHFGSFWSSCYSCNNKTMHSVCPKCGLPACKMIWCLHPYYGSPLTLPDTAGPGRSIGCASVWCSDGREFDRPIQQNILSWRLVMKSFLSLPLIHRWLFSTGKPLRSTPAQEKCC